MADPFSGQASADLSFGDICRGPWFYDAYLRADGSALRRDVAQGKYAEKKYGAEEVPFFLAVDADNPALRAKNDEDYVLAHGVPHSEAACLSDDCVVETLLGRDGSQPRGRLLFAPVTPFRHEEAESLTQSNWRRQRLGSDRVVELHRPFMVATQDVAAALDDGSVTRRSLAPQPLADLAARWAAQSTRRGIYVAASNAEKLGDLLIETGGRDRDEATRFAQALTTLAATAWRLEGRGLETAGQERDDHRQNPHEADAETPLAMLDEDLGRMETALGNAREALAPLIRIEA